MVKEVNPVSVKLSGNKNHIDALAFADDGKLLIGASNLSGRHWFSTISYFSHIDKAQESISNPDAQQGFEEGICDLKFIDSKKFVCAFDSGSIQILELRGDKHITFTSIHYGCSHDALISSIDISYSKKFLVSSSHDLSIKVWDLEELRLIKSFQPAHSDLITCAAFHPTEDNIFLSCGQDKQILMWDTRKEKPASSLISPVSKDTPTAAVWNPTNPNIVCIGFDTGRVQIIDVVEKSSVTLNVHQRSIFRLAHFPFKSSHLACCSDDNVVSVIEYSKDDLKLIYSNASHSDFVRGIAWNPISKCLVSCGWDKNVMSHNIVGDD